MNFFKTIFIFAIVFLCFLVTSGCKDDYTQPEIKTFNYYMAGDPATAQLVYRVNVTDKSDYSYTLRIGDSYVKTANFDMAVFDKNGLERLLLGVKKGQDTEKIWRRKSNFNDISNPEDYLERFYKMFEELHSQLIQD